MLENISVSKIPFAKICTYTYSVEFITRYYIR